MVTTLTIAGATYTAVRIGSACTTTGLHPTNSVHSATAMCPAATGHAATAIHTAITIMAIQKLLQ